MTSMPEAVAAGLSHPVADPLEEMPSSPSSATSDGQGVGVLSLSPPPSCLQSTPSAPADRGRLFSLRVSTPGGVILHSHIFSHKLFSPEEFGVGKNFFSSLVGNSQSFFLSAAIGSTKQRLFSRIKSLGMSHACELLCEFDLASSAAQVSAFALRSAFEPLSAPLLPLLFSTKHTANCALTHIDLSSIPYLGHLPTDLIGRSLLSFVYAPDVHIVRQAHLDLHACRGRVVRSSASLRFVAFNGALVRAETEWSAYVNPWSRRIELVVARHRVVDAPVGDANVLAECKEGERAVLPPALLRIFEDELRVIMAKPIPPSRSSVTGAAASLPAPPRAEQLGVYIERLVENFVVNGTSAAQQQHDNAVQTIQESSGRNSDLPPAAALPCQIPLPLSYNQINCLENVHRLLKSQSAEEDATIKEEPMESVAVSTPSIPLTRETLAQHTQKYEAEYRATWSRRLSAVTHKRAISLVQQHLQGRLFDDLNPPPAKQLRPSTSSTPGWTAVQREEYYRSLAPNPAPPPGHNFQITSMPLPSAAEVAAAVGGRSAFTCVTRPVLDGSAARHFTPLSISTDAEVVVPFPVSVIKTPEAASLLVQVTRSV